MEEERPWGTFKVLADEPGFKVKILDVGPGKRLSYQSHGHREERWVVVEGTAGVLLEGTRSLVERGGTFSIGVGQKHRLDNPTGGRLLLVEVQIGDVCDESDIVRYEDDHGRADRDG